MRYHDFFKCNVFGCIDFIQKYVPINSLVAIDLYFLNLCQKSICYTFFSKLHGQAVQIRSMRHFLGSYLSC